MVQEGSARVREVLEWIDDMPEDGVAFERFLCELFGKLGHQAQHTGGPGDRGVDIVVTIRGERFAVQAKKYSGKVNHNAVYQVVGGAKRRRYKCQRTMVVTNSEFNDGAKEAARDHDCELVDRHVLQKWIEETGIRADGLIGFESSDSGRASGTFGGTTSSPPVPEPRATKTVASEMPVPKKWSPSAFALWASAAIVIAGGLWLRSSFGVSQHSNIIETPHPVPSEQPVWRVVQDQNAHEVRDPVLRAVYRARLGPRDHVNSSGQRLDSAAAIVRQDRANFHTRRLRDAGDQTDPLFENQVSRAYLGEVLESSIGAVEAAAILEGSPLVEVEIEGDTARLRILSE